MKRTLSILCAAAWVGLAGGQPERPGAPVRFGYVDVLVDAGATALAAYQVELSAGAGVKIVGIEGGESGAFKEPPYYDPAALSQNRVIVAAFNTGKDLPHGSFYAARLHVQIIGSQPPPKWEVKLIVAAS